MGSLSGRKAEVCEELRKRRVDVCCTQEVRWCSNFNYKPQTESRQQHVALYTENHARSAAIMIEETSRHMECTYFNLDYSQMPAVVRQWKGQGARFESTLRRRYKLWWSGNDAGFGGVGILVKEQISGSVVEVKRKIDRVMVIVLSLGRKLMRMICAYVPQSRRSE